MNEQNTTLDEALEKLDEDFENLDEELDEADDNAADENEDSDLDYDEDGNVTIPEDDEESAEGDEDAEADADNGEDSEKSDEASADEKADTKDAEKENLKAELARYKAQARDTLEKLGVKLNEGDDLLDGLVKLAAEADDSTPEEYLKKKTEEQELEAARQLIAQQKGEAIRRADLEELHRLFPETSEYDDISKLPNFKRFGELRVNGLTAEEAYSASHSGAIKNAAAEKAKKNTLAGTKSHLKSSVPEGAKNDEITISRQEIAEMRELYPGMSDKEIASLYKRVK